MQRIEQRGTTASLLVVNAETGERVFAHRPNARLLPASTLKLVSTHYALRVHGPAFRYQTRVEWLGTRERNIFNGNVVLHASGDPSLGSWRFPDTALDRMLQAIDGVTEWRGDVYIMGRQGERMYMPGWSMDDVGSIYAAPPTRFVWSENAVRISLAKRLGYDVTLIHGGEPWCRRNGMHVTCAGGMQRVAVEDGEQLFRMELEDALVTRGIKWKRALVNSGEKLTEVVLESPPLGQLVWMTNKLSLNLYAERIAALVSGIPMQGVHIADGSGMSRYNLLTTEYLVDVLQQASPELFASLPIAGVDGTLRWRKGSGKVFAKTGTLWGQRGLAGYALTPKGPVWFAFLIGNELGETTPMLDELMVLLTQ